MTSDDALFSLGEPQGTAPRNPEPRPAPIREEQISQIREAFATAGIFDMEERRAVIESCVQRPIALLRELRTTDVRFVLDRLKTRAATLSNSGTTGSIWDQRDEETWIDRL